MAMDAIILVGVPARATTDFAALRLVDTVAGAEIAVGSTSLHPEPGRTTDEPEATG